MTYYTSHDLNLSTPEALAADLAYRFKGTVEYGYFSEDYEFVALGSTGNEKYNKQFRLIDLWNNGNTENADEVTFGTPLYEFESLEKCDTILEIHQHIVELSVFYNDAWDGFCEFFFFNNRYTSPEAFEGWRYKIRRMLSRIGGESYVAVESESLIDTQLSWSDALEGVALHVPEKFLNIPQYFKKERLRERTDKIMEPLDAAAFETMQYAHGKGISIEHQSDYYPQIFYDDFSDLQNSRVVPAAFDTEAFEQVFVNFKVVRFSDSLKKVVIVRETLELPQGLGFAVLTTSVSGIIHNSPVAVAGLRIHEEVYLWREPKNRFDSNAIVIGVGNDCEDCCILGYIPRDRNDVLAAYMDLGTHYRAFVMSVNDTVPLNYHDRVRIRVFDCGRSDGADLKLVPLNVEG